MNKKIIKQLFKKEMLDVLRDKKTVLMMVVVPLVLYPLIMLLGMQVMTSVSQDMAKSTYNIAIADGEKRDEYVKLFEDREYENEVIRVVSSEDLDNDLLQGTIDLFIDIDGESDTVKIHYLSASNRSNYAVNVVLDVLNEYSDEMTEDMLVEAGLTPDEVLNPIKITYADWSTAEESTGSLLGSILPFMLVVSILMGTMYPAIDTTSGEKERGTLETILTLPVTSRELIFSKFLAVGLFGIVSALLNIISMCGVMAYLFNMMASVGANNFASFELGKFAMPILIGVLCVFAFAIFVSAISMCVCAFAKSYKEANNYITPVSLVVMLASFISFIPNIELTKNMALVPVANLCLLLRDLLVFKFDYLNILLVLFSNIIYAIVSVLVLGKIYNSESIMFGDGQSGIGIFEKRSNMKKGGVPTLGDCGFVVVLMALIYLYAGSTLQLKYQTVGLVLSQLLFILVPLSIVIYSKKSVKETFKLKLCKPGQFLGGIIFGIAVIFWNLIVSAISTAIFKDSATSSQEGLQVYMPDSFVLGLLVLAVTPAICEEMFFRGYVFSSLEKKLKLATAILLSAALFGVFHMSLAKLLSTAFLGGMIALVGHKTKSIFPGMMIHFMNNTLACVAMYYPMEIMDAVSSSSFSAGGRALAGLLLIAIAIGFPILGYKLISGKKENEFQNFNNQMTIS